MKRLLETKRLIDILDIHPDIALETLQRARMAAFTLVKWLLCSVLSGSVIGLMGALFYKCLQYVTNIRTTYSFTLFFLPLAGIIIVFIYRLTNEADNTGTNLVITAIQSNVEVPVKVTPLIIISTLLTHLCGGSAGREGAALQVGGSLGDFFAKIFNFDDKDTRIMIMCGMSACFSALFGTPIAAAVFSMEVISVGVMYYAALLPCVVASLVAYDFAGSFGIHPENFHVTGIPAFSMENGIKMGIIAVGCGAVSILFCLLLEYVSKGYDKWLKNPYLRVFAAGCLVVVLYWILGTDRYMGAGNQLIEQAVEHGQTQTFDFFWKMLLTALAMRAGFRGGEIVPSFAIGATFGCLAGQIMGFSPSLSAAAGMTAVFCGVTNCPVTSILIAFELFGFQGVSYYLLAVAVSYAVSGYYGLYKDQTIVYSKYKAKYVNRHTKT